MPSPGPHDLRCWATALRYAAKRSHKLNVTAELIARARRLQELADHLERERRGRDAIEASIGGPRRARHQ
jgi:hypothetical protein